MADSESQEKTTKAAAGKQSAPPPDDTAPPIPVDQLVADGSALLGYESWVVAGAMAGLPSDMTDGDMTIDDATTEVESWLQRPVEVDPRVGEE